ncbi:hypothetical protein IWQ49_000898 [Labrenzia sp. EL_126]|nr:hypothetical protein [Labrenzia sp. EL_126]
MKDVSFTRSDKGKMELWLLKTQTWEDFDVLAEHLKSKYRAELYDYLEGPYSRYWTVKVDGQEMELRHDDEFGNALRASNAGSEDVVRKIGIEIAAKV